MEHNKDVSEEVLRRLRQIIRRVSEQSKALARHSGLTLPQLICLKAIGDRDPEPMTVATVSSEVSLSPGTVSRIVDRLERAKLVLRERDAVDRRKVCLTLTAAGYERFQTLPQPLQETFLERLMALPEEERNELLQALRKITAMMDATDLDAAPILSPEVDMRDSSREVS